VLLFWLELRVLCLLSRHSTSPFAQSFCSHYCEIRVSLFAQIGLNLSPPILGFPPLLEWQAHTTTPSFFPLRWGFANFLPRLTWNHGHLSLSSCVAWDDRQVPLCPGISWDGISWITCWGWPQTSILLISASHIARITGVSPWHLTYPGFNEGWKYRKWGNDVHPISPGLLSTN
jgi:hypothetical protein